MEKEKNEDPIGKYQNELLNKARWIDFFKSYWKTILLLGTGLVIGWVLGFQDGFTKGVWDGYNQTMNLYVCFKK